VDAASGTDISPATDVARGDEPDAGVNLGPDVIAPMPGDGGGGYGNDGPDSYTTAALSVTNGSDTFTVNLWIPTSPGAHPVVSFSPGLQAPSAGYTPYATRLASWGFVVLMRDDPGILVSGDVVVSDLSYTVATWLPAQSTSTGSALFGKVDLTRVGLAGHSRGGQVTLDAAEEGLQGKVAAWVGLDPVNTAYTPGTAPSTNLPSIGIPTTYIGAGVATNCAPMNDNYQVLYAVSPSPSIAITVANASHTQFMDLMGCSACGALVCSPLGTANSQDVLDLAIRYLTAFFARELLGDASVGTLFQGAGAPADLAAGVIQMVSK
jgi:pimeloyl-ACP methyl ester carboxylesterase